MAIFVVKEHWARSHHFDFRLEKDGVFKSWAVPKGLPESPGVKRLAVQVEDHELEFAPFHEANPKGESVKGRIKVWDHGTYELEEWTEDRIAFDLNGCRVSGKFSLFRFKESDVIDKDVSFRYKSVCICCLIWTMKPNLCPGLWALGNPFFQHEMHLIVIEW